MAKTKEVKKVKADVPVREKTGLVFGKLNYQLLVIGLVVIVLGFLLLAGGGSDDPNRWDPSIFSFRRITLAPVVILIGFVIEGVAIMYRPKAKKKE
jgi:hypothetical protein